jgi:adenylate kinase family enzyme
MGIGVSSKKEYGMNRGFDFNRSNTREQELALSATEQIYKGILLIGPTGSGKTPLGEFLETAGMAGRRCFHFDFGEQLRVAAQYPERYPLLMAEDVAVIRNSLQSGTLLEDSQFGIVKLLFSSFVRDRQVGEGDAVLLNGMPRHVGQAEKITDFVDVVLVVYLNCDDDTVRARIRTNAGGDRTFRVDDDIDAVVKKCATFKKRTMPLLSFYRDKSAGMVLEVLVDAAGNPKDIADTIDSVIRARTVF